MNSNGPDFDWLIARVYEAAMQGLDWKNFAAQAADVLGVDHLTLIARDGMSVLHVLSSSISFNDYRIEAYPGSLKTPIGQLCASAMCERPAIARCIADLPGVAGDPFYRKVLVPADCAGVIIAHNRDGGIDAAASGLLRSGRDNFSGRQIAAFASLARHLTSALALRERLMGRPKALPQNFTPREIEVAQALLRAPGIDSVALQLGIRRETARSHLKTMFQKTHTRNQAELLCLLSTPPDEPFLRR